MIGLLGVLVACGDRKPLATGPEDPRPDPDRKSVV